METKQVASKILAVMKDVGWVEKDGHNTFQNYDYATEVAVVAKVRESMIKHNLILISNVIKCEVKESTTSAKTQWRTDLIVEGTFIDCDSGESLKASSAGSGVDHGDKDTFKATTGANKYLLLKTLQIPTGDDPEADEGTDRDNAPQRTQQTQKPTQQAPTGQQDGVKTFPSKYGSAEKPNNCTWCGGYHVKAGDPLVTREHEGGKKTYGHVDCYKAGLERG